MKWLVTSVEIDPPKREKRNMLKLTRPALPVVTGRHCRRMQSDTAGCSRPAQPVEAVRHCWLHQADNAARTASTWFSRLSPGRHCRLFLASTAAEVSPTGRSGWGVFKGPFFYLGKLLLLPKNAPFSWATKITWSPTSTTQTSWCLENRRRRPQSTFSPKQSAFPPHLLEVPLLLVFFFWKP
jgi:hypothetical protein